MAWLEKTIMQNNENHFQGKINRENRETKSSTEAQKIPPKETALVTLFPILKFVQADS